MNKRYIIVKLKTIDSTDHNCLNPQPETSIALTQFVEYSFSSEFEAENHIKNHLFEGQHKYDLSTYSILPIYTYEN